MPIYTYSHCDNIWEATHKIADRHREKCPECGKKSILIITATKTKPVVYDYYDNGLDERVTGPQHRRRLMKQKDLEER